MRGIPDRHVLLFLCLLWLIVTAYNIFKPYHIDDGVYLQIAQWIRSHPLHPMSGHLNWLGSDEPVYKINQPHLYFYLLSFWISVFGVSEPATHVFQSFFSFACIILFYRLAHFYVRGLALWLTAIMILGPAFLVGQNLMVDVPLLAIWLCFFNLLVCEVESEHQTERYLFAALACSAAILVKYSSLVLYVILCISLLFERRKRQFWTMLIPLVVLAAWSAFNYFDYGGIQHHYQVTHG
jgi:4-amino-4-deoxy-L-arabinose transferase-like glycosyltransferase